jgi:hypothetical protein
MGYIKAKPGWRGSTSDSKGNVVNNLTLGQQSHDGALFGSGTSAANKTSSTASKKMASFYTSNSASSGTSVGLYWKHTLTGAASGVVARFYGYSNVASTATLVGAQITGEIGATATITGLITGCRSQLSMPDDGASYASGTFAGGQSEIYFNGDNSSTTDISAAARHSIHRFILDGDTTARAKTKFAFEFVNLPSGSAEEMVSTKYLTASHGLQVMIDGARYYMLMDAV